MTFTSDELKRIAKLGEAYKARLIAEKSKEIEEYVITDKDREMMKYDADHEAVKKAMSI